MKILLIVVGGTGLAFQSGRPHFVEEALRRIADVDVLALPETSLPAKARSRVSRLFGLGNRLPDRSPSLLHAYAEKACRRMEVGSFDAAVSSTTLVTSIGRLPVPTATWADAPLTAVLNNSHYPGFSNVSPARREVALQAEASALENATVSAFPSDWGVDLALAINSAARVELHPFGPNMDEQLRQEVLTARRARSRTGPPRLLFNGVSWRRKGGDMALQVANRLTELIGTDVHLTFLGLDRPRHVPASHSVSFLGRVNKDSPAGRRLWVETHAEADLLLFPTRAENYGAAVAEAAACGIPVVVSQVGGAWQTVSKGGFGYVVPAFGSAEAEDLAQASLRILIDRRLAGEFSTAGVTAVDDWLNYDHSLSSLLGALLGNPQ